MYVALRDEDAFQKMKRKRQSNLFAFLGKPDCSIPRYLVYRQTHNTAIFTYAKPKEKVICSSQIHWRDQSTTLTILVIGGEDISQIYRPKSMPKWTSPFLKSMLQKCIRRREAKLAVKSALALIELDPFSLLRRLPIIMAEDAIVYPEHWDTLVALMAAVSKGYELRICDVAWILGLVSLVAEEELKCRPCFISPNEPLKRLDVSKVFSLPQRNLLYSIGLRRSFGIIDS